MEDGKCSLRQRGDSVRVLAFFLALLGFLILSFLIRAEVDFRYRRQEEKDHLEIRLRALSGLWRFEFQIPTVQLEWEKGPALDLEQVARSGTGQTHGKTEMRLRYVHMEFFWRLWPHLRNIFLRLNRIKARLYRRIHCTALESEFAIGFKDPAQTALATGAIWAALGMSVARLYRQITMEVPKPLINVVPRFQTPGFSCHVHCIFRLRIGHIILAGIDLLRVLRLDKRG